MSNPYEWSPTAAASSPLSEHLTAGDLASVAEAWVTSAYDDLRRVGPDRAVQVRWMLERYVVPWFGPQTSTVGDITYFMVHEWLLRLVGRGQAESSERRRPFLAIDGTRGGRELSLRKVAEEGEVSVATARRRWRDGELPGGVPASRERESSNA